MKIPSVCKDFFNDFLGVCSFKKNGNVTNLSRMKILSYIAIFFSLSIAVGYGIKSLLGRATKKPNDPSTAKAASVAQQTLNPGQNKATEKQKAQGINPSVFPNFLKSLPVVTLNQVRDTYQYDFGLFPMDNFNNLQPYSQSPDCARHAQSARIYYNSEQLSRADALKVIFQREPTNVKMQLNQYNPDALEKLWGYRQGVYTDLAAKKEDGSLFKELPNTAAVYSETYLWNPPGGEDRKEIACLSLPAPALDVKKQPHYNYYVDAHGLVQEKYQQEMHFLFRTIEKAVRENKDTAFNGKGIQRIILTKFGQGAFLEALCKKDQELANQIYKQKLVTFQDNIQATGLSIVMSEYTPPKTANDQWLPDMVVGNIIEVAQEYDLIINPWDPNSAPGNGNDQDDTLDGWIGRASGILLTQTSWLNPHLRSEDALVAVK